VKPAGFELNGLPISPATERARRRVTTSPVSSRSSSLPLRNRPKARPRFRGRFLYGRLTWLGHQRIECAEHGNCKGFGGTADWRN
jgi:hypothetical protein